ncbi:hypothetical protein Baya_15771 [Bagarius yarrelli]|uniref:Uncharacterized protein n=1 Tax=Bagarius yarrelli TaxID=175774 RepID=A0A556VCL5_BAGYA|nr:hypothetical protein Baya_15771 [Bagarius yarrelli]
MTQQTSANQRAGPAAQGFTRTFTGQEPQSSINVPQIRQHITGGPLLSALLLQRWMCLDGNCLTVGKQIQTRR